jgi:hypothetical protein
MTIEQQTVYSEASAQKPITEVGEYPEESIQQDFYSI